MHTYFIVLDSKREVERIVPAIILKNTNVCKKYSPQNAPLKEAILIFTSPSTVHCFNENFAWDESYKVIAIGKKTAAVLPLHVKPYLPLKQTIAACVELAKQIRS